MNKQILLGTVSAVALMLAAHGAAQAQSTSTTTTSSNVATGVTVDTSNEIEAFAFKHFTGALQAQQNGSVNSSVSQNMAIDAFKLRNVGVGFFSAATSTNTVSGNSATSSSVPAADSEGTDNSIEDSTFKHAKGAVQVQQNRSINSSTGQNMDIDPISDRGGTAGFSFDTVSGTASLANTVNGNTITKGSVGGGNSITDGAFKHAKGAFEVQQNNSINSSTQQNMAITAQDDRGGSPGPVPTAEADLTQNVQNNSASPFNPGIVAGVTVDGSNTIDAGAFKDAAGAFQVQQSNSANSAAGQNMAVGAFDARNGSGGGSDGRGDDAVSKSTVTGNLAQGFNPSTVVDTENAIDGGAFKHARGAFQVQQNGSINSAVGQNMAVSAVKETGAATDKTISASATSTNTVSDNVANPISVVTSSDPDNDISGSAFKHAKGAFQVQQNRSIDSSTGQNMKVTAVSDPRGTVSSSVSAAATLTSTVDSNFVTNDPGGAVTGANAMTDGAFKHAAGAFQAQQNNSTNSSTQQNMAVVALKAEDGPVKSFTANAEADLTHTVSGNLALAGVTSSNVIDDRAFKDARGAFQVQQSTSSDSAVGQNMAIAAGTASADAAVSTTTVSGNIAGIFFGTAGFNVNIDADNTIDDFAFKNARGAFQVQQNASVNGSASQNMAVSALKESGRPTDPNVLASATSNNSVTGNQASTVHIDSDNTIDDFAFKNAAGAFQVQQNASVNSSTGQNMRILAVSDPNGTISSNLDSTATLNSTVGGSGSAANTASNSTVSGDNSLEDFAFKNAKGAFQVQQNNSINSSTQQNMAIEAVSVKDATSVSFSSDEIANLGNVVTGNTATSVTVAGLNQIDNHAFQNARGAFQVQQNNSANSAVSQNMSIVAVSTTGRH